MRLSDLRSTITASTKDDWEQIVCWGGGSGPSYLTSMTAWSKGDALGLDIESHGVIAVYREDVNLRIAWGWDPDGSDRPDLAFPWQGNFTDHDVSRLYADIFWRGSLVDRLLLLSVDGGRAILPIGVPQYDKSSDNEYTWLTNNVDNWEYLFARLVHSFEHVEDYDKKFAVAGFTRI